MPKHLKIKSFTLSEMMVVVGITGIVVGLAFSVLTLVRQQMKSMAQHYDTTTQWQLLEQSLWIDLNRYPHITYYPEGQFLRMKHDLDSVNYVFYADKIVKDRDTFFVSVKTKTFYSEGNAVSSGTLDAIRLRAGTAQEDPTENLFIYTNNDATKTLNAWHFN